MISHFLKLEWKQFFRSSSFSKSIGAKILIGFFGLYFTGCFLLIGIGAYWILKKQFPEQDPLVLVNSFLMYAIIGDLIFRYIMQKLPVMNIKPLLVLPIKRSKILNYVLGKSANSFIPNDLKRYHGMPLYGDKDAVYAAGCNAAASAAWARATE